MDDNELWLALLLTIHWYLATGHCAQYQGFYYNAIVIICHTHCTYIWVASAFD